MQLKQQATVVTEKQDKGTKVTRVKSGGPKNQKKPQTSTKKAKNQSRVVEDHFEFMNLSLGTFGSIDKQINQAENMIAEFE